MKKAVSSVIAFLKRKKDDLTLPQDTKPADSEDTLGEAQSEQEDRFSVIRLCRRCVLVYENKTWNEYVTQRSIRRCNNSTELNYADVYCGEEKIEITRSNYVFSANLCRGFPEIIRVQRSISLTLIFNHILRCAPNLFSLNHNYGPHYPLFIWLQTCENEREGEVSNTYEDDNQIVISFPLDVAFLLSNLSIELPVSGKERSLIVWVIANKFPRLVIALDLEEDLIDGYLDDIFKVAFLHIPFSVKERQEKIEAIFRAVDEILNISANAIMVSGDSPESAITVKEVIIETATVVTSTAAESTATVGIETAAMALGQAAAGIAISVLVDIAITAGSVTRAKLQRDKGLITNSQFKSTVRRKLCDSGCQFIGGTTGTIVGQVLIPVPVVGAIVGGFFGSLIGVGVSKGIIKTSELIAKAQNSRAKAITEK